MLFITHTDPNVAKFAIVPTPSQPNWTLEQSVEEMHWKISTEPAKYLQNPSKNIVAFS